MFKKKKGVFRQFDVLQSPDGSDMSTTIAQICNLCPKRKSEFIKQKVNYIHSNPVKDKIVVLPEDYYFSSARNYAGLENELEVILLDLF